MELLLRKQRIGFLQFRFIVALILLVAAGLKAYQLATVPLPPVIQGSFFTPLLDLINNRYWLMIVILGEILFGLILIAGIGHQWTWLLSILTFSIFTLISLMKGLSGEGSCGCFGSVTVNPWITTVFDTTIVVLLGIFREPLMFDFKLSGNEKRKLIVALFVWFILTVPILWAMLSFKEQIHATLGTEFLGANGTTTIMLEPEKWIGKEFPLWDYVDEKAGVLKQGDWIIIIGRKQCEECQKLIEKLGTKNTIPLALLELDDGMADTNKHELYPSVSIQGMLKIEDNWVILTPCLIQCRNGICIAVDEESLLH
ncbi:MAG: hypothetical protein LBQ50_10655 [Planctomycetaceae bacterium]|jgi:hypothetical protein|nr:hypothetical protein [Planctomycetaceae bacterium]